MIGTGYLGATHAICMAVLGYEVLGVDVDRPRSRRWPSGEVPFFEPGLPEPLQQGARVRSAPVHHRPAEAGEFGDVHFICVGTPQSRGTTPRPDLRRERRTRPGAVPRPALPRSSESPRCPVGTAARADQLPQDLAPAGADVELAWNPEFLREGYAVDDTMRPDRLVFGVSSDWARAAAEAAFAPILEPTPVLVTDLVTAELVKVAANTFLATKISYINAMAEVCEATGADVRAWPRPCPTTTGSAAGSCSPGLGFGGGCLPKDIRAFTYRAEELGVGQAVAFLREVDAHQQAPAQRTVDLVRELCGGDLAAKRIAASARPSSPTPTTWRHVHPGSSPPPRPSSSSSRSRSRSTTTTPRRRRASTSSPTRSSPSSS